MATREQIVNKLANQRVRSHYLPTMTRAIVRQAAQGLTNGEWDNIIEGVRQQNATDVGTILIRQVNEHIKNLAIQDVEDDLAPDDTLTITELEGLI